MNETRTLNLAFCYIIANRGCQYIGLGDLKISQSLKFLILRINRHMFTKSMLNKTT